MTAWIVLATTDLENILMSPQLAVLRTSVLAVGQTDPFTSVMHDRANYVRNRIAGRAQISSTAYAVPPELKIQTCYLVLESMQARIPVLKLTDDQKTLIARAYKDLDIAGTVDFPISDATDAIPAEVSSSVSPKVTGKTLTHDRASQDGI